MKTQVREEFNRNILPIDKRGGTVTVSALNPSILKRGSDIKTMEEEEVAGQGVRLWSQPVSNPGSVWLEKCLVLHQRTSDCRGSFKRVVYEN